MAQRIRGLSVPPHIIYSYSIPPYNLANSNVRQVPEELLTVFRVLKVKEVEYSHVIRNALLDQTSAERLLLVEVREHAAADILPERLYTVSDRTNSGAHTKIKDSACISGCEG